MKRKDDFVWVWNEERRSARVVTAVLTGTLCGQKKADVRFRLGAPSKGNDPFDEWGVYIHVDDLPRVRERLKQQGMVAEADWVKTAMTTAQGRARHFSWKRFVNAVTVADLILVDDKRVLAKEIADVSLVLDLEHQSREETFLRLEAWQFPAIIRGASVLVNEGMIRREITFFKTRQFNPLTCRMANALGN